MIFKEKHSTKIQDMVDETFGHEMVDMMEKISNIEGISDLNTLFFLNKTGAGHVLAAMMFSKLCIDTSSGKPMLDGNLFFSLTKEEQKEQLLNMVLTITGYIESIEKIKSGFENFLDFIYEGLKKNKMDD
jgi:hypothetical protein